MDSIQYSGPENSGDSVTYILGWSYLHRRLMTQIEGATLCISPHACSHTEISKTKTKHTHTFTLSIITTGLFPQSIKFDRSNTFFLNCKSMDVYCNILSHTEIYKKSGPFPNKPIPKEANVNN